MNIGAKVLCNCFALRLIFKEMLQARIQDFEMGGEFSPPQSEKSEKSKGGGSEKRGVKIHPFHLPLIRACVG